MPSFPLSCLAYLSVAVPGSTLGLLWPSMRLSWHQPTGMPGVLLIIGVSASVLASVLTGRLLPRARTGPVVAAGALLVAAALATEAAAPSIWVFAGGMVVFGVGFGALDAALNAHAAAQRAAAAAATRVVSLQVAASAGGNAALPAGLGLVIGALAATALGPSLLLLSLLLAALYRWLAR